MRASVLVCPGVGIGFWAVAPADCQTSAGAIVGVVRDASGRKPDRKHFQYRAYGYHWRSIALRVQSDLRAPIRYFGFATPALGTLGNGARNILRSTGQRAMDMSFFKNFSLWEKICSSAAKFSTCRPAISIRLYFRWRRQRPPTSARSFRSAATMGTYSIRELSSSA